MENVFETAHRPFLIPTLRIFQEFPNLPFFFFPFSFHHPLNFLNFPFPPHAQPLCLLLHTYNFLRKNAFPICNQHTTFPFLCPHPHVSWTLTIHLKCYPICAVYISDSCPPPPVWRRIFISVWFLGAFAIEDVGEFLVSGVWEKRLS
jgi:hypothetical protein